MDEELPEKLATYVTEAYDLRDRIASGEPGEGLTELHDALVASRQVIDRLERIVTDVIRIRARASNNVVAQRAALEDATDVSILKPKAGHLSEYTTGRERQAEWNLATVTERVALMKAERVLRDVDTVLEVVKMLHRGADNARRDIDSRVRILGWEGRFES